MRCVRCTKPSVRVGTQYVSYPLGGKPIWRCNECHLEFTMVVDIIYKPEMRSPFARILLKIISVITHLKPNKRRFIM